MSTSRTLYYYIQPCLLNFFVTPGRNGWKEASGSTTVLGHDPFSLPIQQCSG